VDNLLIPRSCTSSAWHSSLPLMGVSQVHLSLVKDMVVAWRRRMISLRDDSFGYLVVYLEEKEPSDFGGQSLIL